MNERPSEIRSQRHMDGPPLNIQKTVAKIPKLEGDINIPQFKAWKEAWTDYCKLAMIHTLPVDIQRAILRSCFDCEMRNYVKNAIGIMEEDDLSIN